MGFCAMYVHIIHAYLLACGSSLFATLLASTCMAGVILDEVDKCAFNNH